MQILAEILWFHDPILISALEPVNLIVNELRQNYEWRTEQACRVTGFTSPRTVPPALRHVFVRRHFDRPASALIPSPALFP